MGTESELLDGWVSYARRVPSPNYDERPPGTVIDAVVVHCISLPPGEYGGANIEDFFCNCLDPAGHDYFREIHRFRVSAHFLIYRDGELVQFVPTDRRAWHAGESLLAGRANVNDFALGIELEGTDDSDFEPRQYDTLVRLTRTLLRHYPALRADRLVGHSAIAPGRKTDPGPGFDWARYRKGLTDLG